MRLYFIEMIRLITDDLWEKFRTVFKKYGCHEWKNDRNVMEGILWKLRSGAPWRYIPSELCCWKTAYNKFNRWALKGLWDNFFLIYEKKLMKSGCSLMQVMLGRINILAEPVVERSGLLEEVEEGRQQKYILPVIRMETRSILKSLEVTSMRPKLPLN